MLIGNRFRKNAANELVKIPEPVQVRLFGFVRAMFQSQSLYHVIGRFTPGLR
jgi:hypothetical protein